MSGRINMSWVRSRLARRTATCILLTAVGSAGMVQAQESMPPTDEPGCQSAGSEAAELYDDAGPDGGLSFVDHHFHSHQSIVQLFNPGGEARAYRKVCISFHNFLNPPNDWVVEIVALDGVGGMPGAELGSVTVEMLQIPNWLPDDPHWGWYEFDISSMGLSVDHPIYIGVTWSASPVGANIFMSADWTLVMGQPTHPVFLRKLPCLLAPPPSVCDSGVENPEWEDWQSIDDILGPNFNQAVFVRATYGVEQGDLVFSDGFDP